jgi:[ribosomal protein S18]-alanine N-acetyltransferase
MSDLQVSYAGPDDVDALLDLLEEVTDERIWLGTEPGFDRTRKREKFLEAIGRPDETPFWIARIAGTAVGWLNVFHHREAGPTIGMLVKAGYRRRGIGEELIGHVFEWAREHRIARLSLHVFPHNEAARRLYEKTGFSEIERYERDVTRQSGEVWDAILMCKDLE